MIAFWTGAYAFLKNGVIVRRPKGDHFERIVEIHCSIDEAKLLRVRKADLSWRRSQNRKSYRGVAAAVKPAKVTAPHSAAACKLR
jgi:hypothetical protein